MELFGNNTKTFQETETSKKSPYISGKEYLELWHNGTFLILQERNIQNPDITELFLYFRKGTFRTLA